MVTHRQGEIYVTKRDGRQELLDIEKWQAQIAKVCKNIADVSQSMIEIKAQPHFYNNIPTTEIDGITLRAIVDLIDADINPGIGHTNYQYVAGKQRLSMLRKDVYGTYEVPHLYSIVKRNVEAGLYTADLLEWYSEDDWNKMNDMLDHEKDEQYGYAAIEQLIEKYLVRNRATKEIYETPQIRYMIAAATVFHKEEPNTARMRYIKEYYQSASDGLFTLATPVLAGLGTPTKQFSSCVLIRSDDDLDSIFASGEMMAKYASKRAGIGLEIGRLRPLGSPIRGGEIMHTGMIPFLKKWFGDLRSCSQGGIRNACVHIDSYVDKLTGFEFNGHNYHQGDIIKKDDKLINITDVLTILAYMGSDDERDAYLQNLLG
jgi:ribonucleoside-diphosphate reductase alpha chain